RLRMPEALGRAALGFGGMLYAVFGVSQPNDPLVTLLEKALGMIGEAETSLRARLLSRLASALSVAPGENRHRTIAREAVAMSRRLEDRHCLAQVLSYAHWALRGPDDLAERLAISEELVRLVTDLHYYQLEWLAHAWYAADRSELGDYET